MTLPMPVPSPSITPPLAPRDYNWVFGVGAICLAVLSLILTFIFPLLGLVAILGVGIAHIGIYKSNTVIMLTDGTRSNRTLSIIGLISSWIAIHWSLIWIVGLILTFLFNMWMTSLIDGLTASIVAQLGTSSLESLKNLTGLDIQGLNPESFGEIAELLRKMGVM